MTVMQTTVTRSKPGRRHDAIALALEASKLLERHGAVRQPVPRRPDRGRGHRHPRVHHRVRQRGGVGRVQRLAQRRRRARGADEPGRPRRQPGRDAESMSVGTTIHLGRSGPTERGRSSRRTSRGPIPGRFTAALELGATVFDFVERMGATNCRLSQLSSAGMLTECLVASWELESMKALGRLGDAFGTDRRGAADHGDPHGGRRPDHPGHERHLLGDPAVGPPEAAAGGRATARPLRPPASPRHDGPMTRDPRSRRPARGDPGEAGRVRVRDRPARAPGRGARAPGRVVVAGVRRHAGGRHHRRRDRRRRVWVTTCPTR